MVSRRGRGRRTRRVKTQNPTFVPSGRDLKLRARVDVTSYPYRVWKHVATLEVYQAIELSPKEAT